MKDKFVILKDKEKYINLKTKEDIEKKNTQVWINIKQQKKNLKKIM